MEASVVAVVIGLAGMVVHWWKEKINKQTLDSLKTYVIGHPVYTICATVATGFACWVAAPATLGELANVTVVGALFTIGYTCDSLINKAVNSSTFTP